MSKLIDVDYIEIRHETDRAWLIQFERGMEPVWIPKSLAEMSDDESVVTIPMWLAEEKGLGDDY